jgi:hypothetical protein
MVEGGTRRVRDGTRTLEIKVQQSNESKRKSSLKKSDSIAMVPVECTVKITAGTAPGTVKTWECRKCDQLNHWKRYSCELCGRRAGGPAWDVTMSPSADNGDTSSSSSLPCNNWVCHKCNMNNQGSSLCTACFASKIEDLFLADEVLQLYLSSLDQQVMSNEINTLVKPHNTVHK